MQYVGSLNNNLTPEQMICIERRPFRWMTNLKGSMKININLWRSLLISGLKGGVFSSLVKKLLNLLY